MEHLLKEDLINFEALLEKAKLQGLDYLQHLPKRKTSTVVQSITNANLNEEGIGGLETLAQFKEKWESQIVGASGPRYLGYVVGGTTPASIMGDWLASIYDQNPQTVSSQGDVSVQIEHATIQLMLDLFQLPNDFLGGFVSGATMSNFTCLGVARQWIGKERGLDFAKDGIQGDLNILSAVPHSSALKCLSMLGIGSKNYTLIETIKENREAIDIQDLRRKIESLNGAPFILISSAGTVNTADFDDFKAIAELKVNHNFWWHIDGAFGGFAACSPKYDHLTEGWDKADSITVDCHKWLNVPYDSAVFFVRKQHSKLQMETFQNSNAPYLGDPSENFNYLNFLPENSRRLRALPAWFSLTAYGKKGYRYIVENAVDMAQLFSNFIEETEALELLAPTRLNNVCFTLKSDASQARVYAFLDTLNKSKLVYMTPTKYQNSFGIRASFVNWRTNAADIDIITSEILKATAHI
ncbi:pyridoxal phosphate-dependent decarboxylase family protein [Zobellia uliginosa]|uniref:pyridoxal phosphate-dependent decarboxylase family protein n=1 Tax=Zobellia uliginosa TaxID=143224 RepID=UPI001C07E068|nr:pyridoxal-dependent decarboxylase [Zobellia uliginosa]MBU2946163.1 aspartate aminotransferase family protein [Zobellia uliginosa]